MARQLRLDYEGAIYHVTVRSNGGEDLFGDDKDRVYLLGRIKESAEQHGVRVYLFCLMTNHFHLVVETPQGNLGRFMQSLLTAYPGVFQPAASAAWACNAGAVRGTGGGRGCVFAEAEPVCAFESGACQNGSEEDLGRTD